MYQTLVIQLVVEHEENVILEGMRIPGEAPENMQVETTDHRGFGLSIGYHRAIGRMQQRMDAITFPTISGTRNMLDTNRAMNVNSRRAIEWRNTLVANLQILQAVAFPNVAFQRYTAYRQAFHSSCESLDDYLTCMGLCQRQIERSWQVFDASDEIVGHQFEFVAYATSKCLLPYGNPPRERLDMQVYDWRSHVAWFLRAWAGLSENIVLQVFLSRDSWYHMSRPLTRQLLMICSGFTRLHASQPHHALRERYLVWIHSSMDWQDHRNLQARVGPPQDTAILRNIQDLANGVDSFGLDGEHVPIYKERLLDHETHVGHTARLMLLHELRPAQHFIRSIPVAESSLSAWTEFVMVCLEREEHTPEPTVSMEAGTDTMRAVIQYAHAVHSATPDLAREILGTHRTCELFGRFKAQYMMGWLAWPEAVVVNPVQILRDYTRSLVDVWRSPDN